MRFKLLIGGLVLASCAAAAAGQNDLQIKKKITRQMPGLPPTQSLPPAMAERLKKAGETATTVSIKGAKMRTDVTADVPTMTGGTSRETFSTIIECDRRRVTTFDTKSRKYHRQTTDSTAKNAKKGGVVTVTGSVTDTGERAQIFGFEARRLKQTLVFKPGANACQKQEFQIEIDGWYAEVPGFSCPMRPVIPENTGSGDCFDEIDFQVTGAATGAALKEIKKITFAGQTITIDEEATAVSKTSLLDSFFEPPADYRAVDASGPETAPTTANETPSPVAASSGRTAAQSATLPLPVAALEKQPPGEKRAGAIRIGVARPQVVTPDSKKDPNAGDALASAVAASLVEALGAGAVEAVLLETDQPAIEARQKSCDYIFQAVVTQKRGGGMFGKMLAMGAASAAGMLIPGVGGLIAATAGSVLLGQTMGQAAKAKDEFSLDYKILALDQAVLARAVTKKKAEKDGEDVLTPQLQEAAKTALAEIAKKQLAVSP